MALQDKYRRLIDYAGRPRVENLVVSEQDNVLYISGTTTQAIKNELWNMYDDIDPDMRSGDVIMNINAIDGDDDDYRMQTYEVQAGDSLSKIASKFPGMSWNKIYEANTDTISDPNVIKPGQKIKIPV